MGVDISVGDLFQASGFPVDQLLMILHMGVDFMVLVRPRNCKWFRTFETQTKLGEYSTGSLSWDAGTGHLGHLGIRKKHLITLFIAYLGIKGL